MSITDELRDYIKEQQWCAKGILTAIADRIDLEHAHGMEERADRYSELRAKMNNCYVELPKDADGEVWHIGDVTENGEVVNAMRLDSHGWIFLCRNDIDPSIHRHYHAPTVEDVLDEFASAYDRIGGEDEEHQKYLNLIAEYAAKLRLAGDAE